MLLKTVIRTIWRRPTKRTITGIFGGLLLTFCIYLTFRFYSLGFRSNDDDIDGVNTVTMFVFLDILLLGVCLHCFGILPFASGLSLNGRGNDELRKFLPQKVDYHRKFGRSPRKKSLLRGAITWIVAGLGCFWLIGFIGDKTGIFNDPRMDAYDAAINFTKQNYPGAQSFAPYDRSSITVNGGLYRVDFLVKGVNAYNAPLDNEVEVQETVNGKTWYLVSINQQ